MTKNLSEIINVLIKQGVYKSFDIEGETYYTHPEIKEVFESIQSKRTHQDVKLKTIDGILIDCENKRVSIAGSTYVTSDKPYITTKLPVRIPYNIMDKEFPQISKFLVPFINRTFALLGGHVPKTIAIRVLHTTNKELKIEDIHSYITINSDIEEDLLKFYETKLCVPDKYKPSTKPRKEKRTTQDLFDVAQDKNALGIIGKLYDCADYVVMKLGGSSDLYKIIKTRKPYVKGDIVSKDKHIEILMDSESPIVITKDMVRTIMAENNKSKGAN